MTRSRVAAACPYTNEAASAEVYNTIFYVAESPHQAGTLWVGTDDGLVHLTRDGGKSWANVTPKQLGETQINAIEVSPHDAAKAYLAVTGYKLDDMRPEIYRTEDFGKTWTKLVAGLPEDTFVRVVREDPARRGLLYAGAEAGMFVSFDDGGRWQPLQQKLPRVPITDLQVRRGSLVAATQGRAFWILDDLGPLRQITSDIAAAEHHLYRPSDAYRLIRRGGYTRKPGKNPTDGAIVHLYLRADPDPKKTLVSVEILDAANAVIRRFSNRKSEVADVYNQSRESHARDGKPYGLLQLKKGMNRLVWDLRRENVTAVPGHLIPSGWKGPRVLPGQYKARLRVGDTVTEESFRLLDDPRRKVPSAEFDAYRSVVAAVYDDLNQLHSAIVQARAVRKQVTAMLDLTRKHASTDAIRNAGDPLIERIRAWERRVIQEQRETQQDVANFPNRLSMQLISLLAQIDASEAPVSVGSSQRATDLHTEWQQAKGELEDIFSGDVKALNALLNKHGVRAVHVEANR